jgi:hypothetical protein
MCLSDVPISVYRKEWVLSLRTRVGRCRHIVPLLNTARCGSFHPSSSAFLSNSHCHQGTSFTIMDFVEQ